jgi:broad specificity phosphatase PhoE
MDLILIRHAEPQRIAPGTGVPADPGLTELGHEQAARLADWFRHERVDAVLSSPMRRAQETAAPIASAHGLDVEIVAGLIEYDANTDHYIPMEEMKASADPRLKAMIEGRWEEFGADGVEAFRARVAATLDEIIAAHPGQRVVAVCHGGIVNIATALIMEMDRHLWFEPHYTSVTRIAASRGGVRSMTSLNERAHLDGRRDP